MRRLPKMAAALLAAALAVSAALPALAADQRAELELEASVRCTGEAADETLTVRLTALDSAPMPEGCDDEAELDFPARDCRDADDKLAHLKMVIAVGVVMGLHAAYEIFIGGVSVSWNVIWTYLPVSLLYIVSMALGYIGLRYIELSISSPICNASGAVVAVLYLCFGGLDEDLTGGMRVMALAAVALVCLGVIGLGVVESREDDELRRARQAASNYRYAKSWLPVAYCLLDAAGTFADSLVLRSLDPDSANCAYELTFLFAAVVSFVYVKLIRHDRFQPKREAPKYIGALFETAGQFAYIYAIADEDHVMYAAPIIAAYCAASVLWSRIFLREKLSWRHYMMLVLIVAGIVLLGILDI